MKTIRETVDVIVAGGGTAGHIAALQTAREGVRTSIIEEAMAEGIIKKGDFAYPNILPFKYYLDHGGHNATHVYDADTSDCDGQAAANIEGRARMLRMFKFLRNSVPGCERAVLKTMYPFALSRETYRTLGEHVLTKDDFLQGD